MGHDTLVQTSAQWRSGEPALRVFDNTSKDDNKDTGNQSECEIQMSFLRI